MEGVPTTAASIFVILSALFRPPELHRHFMGFMVNDDRIQIAKGQFIYSL